MSRSRRKAGSATYPALCRSPTALADASATWEVRRFDGLLYLATEAGVVEVAVTVSGVTLSQIHPVLDGRNRPLLAPSAFDINFSLQRCLVKGNCAARAGALHLCR